MAELSQEEKDRILNARKKLNQQKENAEKVIEQEAEEDLIRRHGKLLFVSGIISISCLILFCVIMLALFLSGGDSTAQLIAISSFYENLVNLMVLNLNIDESVITTIAMIASIATIVTGFIMSSKMLHSSRQKIALYIKSTASIVIYIVFISLLVLMMVFTIIEIINFILILVLAGFIASIALAIIDLVKTKKLYKTEKTQINVNQK